jgi:hypothetical protein
MLSIIVCSRHEKPFRDFALNIQQTVGLEYELIHIDNSSNSYSIYSAYNAGIQKSQYQHLCFVHEDVLFRTQNWGEKVLAHLQMPGTGIIGLAGGDVMTRVPAEWWTLNSSAHIIHTDPAGLEAQEVLHFPKNYASTRRSVVLLDGVFMCMNRIFFNTIQFDETLGGFHGYDYDICAQSIMAGYSNYVIYDVELEHFSTGNMDSAYLRKLNVIFKKWEKQLPLFERHISEEEQKKLLPKLEKRRMKKLLKNLIRSGMSVNETAEIISGYTLKYGTFFQIFMLRFIQFRIYLIQLTSILRKK